MFVYVCMRNRSSVRSQYDTRYSTIIQYNVRPTAAFWLCCVCLAAVAASLTATAAAASLATTARAAAASLLLLFDRFNGYAHTAVPLLTRGGT